MESRQSRWHLTRCVCIASAVVAVLGLVAAAPMGVMSEANTPPVVAATEEQAVRADGSTVQEQQDIPEPVTTFEYVSSGIQVPLEYVNDDFCDCDDGSDETATSACSHISTAQVATTQGDTTTKLLYSLPALLLSCLAVPL